MVNGMANENDELLTQQDYIDIPDHVLQEWQSIVDLLASIGKVKAALIMRKSEDELEVFLSSKTQDNPYQIGRKERYINSGLYCESVIKQGKMLLVPDASKSVEWKNNPDMRYNMNCYLGFPIRLPDGNYFGTICMLDDKQNDFSQNMKDCMEKMRNLIESNLLLLRLCMTDQLTGIYNRKYLNERTAKELISSEQKNQPITAMMMDINNFKTINDTYGHLTGDDVLRKFAGMITNSLRNQDIAFRFGGDEFFVLMPNTALDEAFKMAERLRAKIESTKIGPDFLVTASIGIAERRADESVDNWFMRLDQALYKDKTNR